MMGAGLSVAKKVAGEELSGIDSATAGEELSAGVEDASLLSGGASVSRSTLSNVAEDSTADEGATDWLS